MPESLRGITEIIFNITYLILIWLMVIKMKLNREKLKNNDRKDGRYLLLAFSKQASVKNPNFLLSAL